MQFFIEFVRILPWAKCFVQIHTMAVPVRNQRYAGHYLERRAAMLDIESTPKVLPRSKSAGGLSGRQNFVS
jgi:hypothetical protein